MTNHSTRRILTLTAAFALAPLIAWADAPATQPSDDIDPGVTFAAPSNVSHEDVLASRSENAEARGPNSAPVKLFICAPASIGFTTKAQPKFVWYLNSPTDLPISIVVSAPRHHDVVLWNSTGTVPAGIHLLDSAGSALELAVGQDYKWSIKVIFDETDASHNNYSSAMIRRIDKSDPNAAQGVFFDILASRVNHLAKSDAAGDTDASAKAKDSVDELLKQVGLDAPQDHHVILDTPTPQAAEQ